MNKAAIGIVEMKAASVGAPDYGMWADDTAYDMREYYEANRPLRWWQKRNPPGSWGCVADELMLGLLDIAVLAERERARSADTPDPIIMEMVEALEEMLDHYGPPGALRDTLEYPADHPISKARTVLTKVSGK